MESKPSIYRSSNFTSNLIEKLLSFNEQQKFSDICIVAADEEKFYAQKCILSASSDYFLTMFDKETKTSELKFHEVKGKALKSVLTFMYTGTIELQKETLEDILAAAKLFQIQSLIKECFNFMGDNLDADNFLETALFAEKNAYVDLYMKSINFASKQYESILDGKEFFKINENQLSSIISSGDLCVKSDENVFLSLIKWIDHDKPNREKCAYNLFSKVRYQKLSLKFIKEHIDKLPKQIECLEMICTWFQWHTSRERIVDAARILIAPSQITVQVVLQRVQMKLVTRAT